MRHKACIIIKLLIDLLRMNSYSFINTGMSMAFQELMAFHNVVMDALNAWQVNLQ